jgi:hypothetical protein
MHGIQIDRGKPLSAPSFHPTRKSGRRRRLFGSRAIITPLPLLMLNDVRRAVARDSETPVCVPAMCVNHSALVSHRRLGRQPLIVAALLQLDYGDGLAPRGIADVTQDGMLLAIHPG